MKKIDVKMQINFAKFTAFAILLFGSIISICLHDAMAFITAVGATAAIVTNRDYQDRKKGATNE